MTEHTRTRVVGAVVVAALVAGGWALNHGFHVASSGAGAKLFDDVLAHVAERYVDSVDVGTLYRRAAEGMVGELGDLHSVFLDSSRLARVQQLATGTYGGLGLEVDVRLGIANVLATLPGTPAEQAGIRPGDRIVAIDGRSTAGWTSDETRRALRGTPGTPVTVTVERLGAPGRTDLLLNRERVYVRPVQRAMLLDDRVGYVSLRTFSDSAAHELAEAIDSLHRAGMQALIFDLRGNPGGILTQGTAIADLFLDAGQTIVTLSGRGADAQRQFVDEHAQRWPELRVAVLVDRSTASASEIVAGALQDHDRALLLGQPSYGKGSAQSVFSFANDAAGVKLTTSRWYTPAGRNIDYVFHVATDLDSVTASDSSARPKFKTDAGRSVLGGGGIVPDVLAGDSISPPPASRAFFVAVGPRMRAYREVVTAYAQVLVRRGEVTDVMFEITPVMRDALYERLRSADITVARSVYDGGREVVERLLGNEAVRLRFGPPAEARRVTLRDKVVVDAARRLRAASTTTALLAAAPPRP